MRTTHHGHAQRQWGVRGPAIIPNQMQATGSGCFPSGKQGRRHAVRIALWGGHRSRGGERVRMRGEHNE